MKKDIDKYYRTPHFSLAVFLFTKGEQIAGINPTTQEHKKEFVFINSSRLEELIDIYKFASKDDEELLVSIHIYEQARKELLDKLNN